MSARVMKPSYREGIEAIALNDEPDELDPESIVGYASVLVLAAAFRTDQDKVAVDVARYRAKARRAR